MVATLCCTKLVGKINLMKIFTVICVLTLLCWPSYSAADIKLDGVPVDNIQTAFIHAKVGSLIEVGAGEYKQAGILRHSNVTIRGIPGETIFHSTTVQGKAAFVIAGNNTRLENIACHSITVRDKNGACVRLEGKNLTLDNVYFHDSQQGLLSGKNSGLVIVKNSRFERLGKAGRAHGIYVGSGKLEIINSFFVSSKDEGHEIKSRAEHTVIRNSVIASQSGSDSRLIDISNGGVLQIYDSVLQQGPNSVNWNLVGYGLEGYRYATNRIDMLGNIILLEREKGNLFLQIKDNRVEPSLETNVFIGKKNDEWAGDNFHFKSREDVGIEKFPFLPTPPKLEE